MRTTAGAPARLARILTAGALWLTACQAKPEKAETPSVQRSALWSSAVNAMSSPRQYHGAAALDGERVLVCGGRTQGSPARDLDSCDLFTVSTRQFAETTIPLGGPRAFLSLTATTGGRLYAIGGQEGIGTPNYHPEVWRFSMSGDTLTRTAETALLTGRSRHTTSWLSGVRALAVIGGNNSTSTYAGDELTRLTDAGAVMGFTAVDPPSARTGHTATVLASGNELFVLGGRGGSPASILNSGTARRLTVPASGTPAWTELTEVDADGLADHTATLLDDGRVFVAGGRTRTLGYSARALIYDPKNGGKLEPVAAMTTPRRNHAAALLDHRVIVTGGYTTGDEETPSVEVFDPSTKTWFSLEPMLSQRQSHVLTVIDERRLLVSGGVIGGATTASAELLTVALAGDACDATRHDCITGHCVDGVCCESACNGACNRCNEPGKLGECQTNVSGEPVGARSCVAGFACKEGACGTTCESHEDCLGSHYCKEGSCVERLPLKSACSVDRECVDGAPCVDGYCCDGACDGPCEACGEAGTPGKCVPVTGTPRGARAACGEPGGDCGLTCDGKDRSACHFQPEGADCGQESCKNGTAQHRSTCDGSGNCKDRAELCAGGLACDDDGVSCRDHCETNADCVDGGHKCSLDTSPAVCVLKDGVGKECPRGDDDCNEDLVCADAYCCGQQCPDQTWSCGLPNHRGECRKPNGESCEVDRECDSDFCVLGVCCESACDGQCETCSSKDHPGECRPQLGDPEQGRRRCDDDDAEFCGKRSCDGVDRAPNRTSCQGFVNQDAVCELAHCESNSYVAERRCADGSCAAATARACSLYACTSDGCNSTCSKNDDCADGATCQQGSCKPEGPKCVGNELQAPGTKPQSCAGYQCEVDHCLTRCEDSKDCSGDYSCDDVTHRCVILGGPPAETPQQKADEGCQCGVPGQRRGSASLTASSALLLAAFGMRRRKRASAPGSRSTQ